jgi:small subunit ribosomal protein S20
MPITKSAIKKLRSDKKKALFNKATRTKAKSAVDSLKVNPTKEGLSLAFSMIDKAAKKGVIKEGKANRMKARLSKKVA